MTCTVALHPTPAAFLDRARPFLLAREAERSLILGIALGLPPASTSVMLATVERGGEVIAVGLQTPPHKLIVTDAPDEAIDALADALREHGCAPSGVTGPTHAAARFAARWSPQAIHAVSMRLHRLEHVAEVPRPTGRIRTGTLADLSALTPWGRGFADESGSDDPRPGAEILRPYLDGGTLRVWLDPDPCCMAGWSRPTPGGAAISLVYTPADRRGRGYATALVAALSEELLSRDKRFCVLYTNLANPTANAIYARIGYRPLEDHGQWSFPVMPATP